MPSFDELMQILADNQVSEEEIAIITAELVKAATLKLYTEIMTELTDEEQAALEKAENEQAEGELLDSFYELHMGKKPEEAIREYQDELAKNFLVDFKKTDKVEENSGPNNVAV